MTYISEARAEGIADSCMTDDDPRIPASVRVLGGKALFQELGDDPGPPIRFDASGLIHPTDITILYGAPGAGKGWVACYVARELMAEGYHPAVLDFEQQARTWQDRAYWMGVRLPYSEMEEQLTRTMAGELAITIRQAGYTHIIVDSISMARGSSRDGDAGGADVATDFMRNVRRLQVPALCIAHEPKRGGSPIGSMQYTAQSRCIYHVERDNNTVTIKREKANDLPDDDVRVSFRWMPLPGGGSDFVRMYQVEGVKEAPKEEPVTNAVIRIMRQVDRSMDADQMQRALFDEGRHTEVTLTKVGTIMRKLASEGRLQRVDRGRYSYPVQQETTE